MTEFFKRHWLSLTIIAVLLWVLYQAFVAAGKIAANLNPLAAIQAFFNALTSFFNNVTPANPLATPQPTLYSSLPAASPGSATLGNAFGLDDDPDPTTGE
jgi:hypothetical protein